MTNQINNQSIMASTDVIQLTLTTQVVKTSVTVNNNSPIQDYVHPDDQTQSTFEVSSGFKPFSVLFNKPYTYFWPKINYTILYTFSHTVHSYS